MFKIAIAIVQKNTAPEAAASEAIHRRIEPLASTSTHIMSKATLVMKNSGWNTVWL